MELELSRIFVKVIQAGSFSKAADILKVPKSTVSKAVSKLEHETGTKLLLRTTRSQTLTQSGRAFYEACLGPVLQLEDAQRSLYGQDSILTGTLRITAPEDLGSYVIAPAVADLAREHSGLQFELIYTNEIIDLVKDGFDIAVRLGKIADSGLKAKAAGQVVLVPVASPRYLKGKTAIKLPADMREHACLSLIYRDSTERWTLRSKHGTAHVPVKPKVMTNQMTSVLQMALQDGGVGLVPGYVAEPYIQTGKLVRLLPDWSTPGIAVSIVTPLAPSASVRLKMAVDHLHKVLVKVLE